MSYRSEVLGARRAGWKSITAIEREPAYVEIAERPAAATMRQRIAA